MATHTVPMRTNTVRYNLPDRRSPRGSMLGSPGSPEDDRAPSEHAPGGFDDNPRAESSESGPVVSYGELMREMAPKLSNTSRGKGKRTVTAAVPRIGTASNVPSSGNMNENYPQTDRMRPRVSILQSSNQETNEILPSESASQVGIPNEESRLGEPDQDGDRETHVSTSSSLACTHQYQQNLRCRVALEMLRRDDIMRNNKSIIPEQGIEVEDDFGYDPAHPNIRINWKKISEMELLGYRKKYPEINRRPTQSNRASNSRTEQRQGNHYNHQPKQGFGNNREQNNAPCNIPTPNGRIPNRDQSPPPPDPNHFRSGVNRGGHGAGGGPPGDPPGSGGGGDDQGSDGEPDRSHRGDSRDRSQAIGPHRYGSEDPNATIEETFEYDPTPRSEEEVLQASFQRYEQLIMFYLYGPPLNQNSAAQKAILQNIPKPGKWGGSSDYMEFEEWFMELVQWMNIADQCGPPTRFSETRGGYILTSVDLTRTNTIGSFLEGKALRWFRDEVQKVPDGFSLAKNPDPLSYRWTFMQAVNGLYQRFIHEASIAQVSDNFYEVTYSKKDGVKVMFSDLKRWAACMPVPPDLYTFKKRILLLVPQPMCNDMTHIEKVSAERQQYPVNEVTVLASTMLMPEL
ncbi:hypothetical protein EV359DRAFT_68496 [Lentinula novae-zelandiae]|nr:hypothetical protein EV359DRAFT_68496 [Lentinula novae-zelandiae]